MSEGYRNIKEIARTIGDFADKVEEGNLQKGDVEEVLQETRVLYERLVVLKFKLQEKEIREVEENMEESGRGEKENGRSEEGKEKREEGKRKREMGNESSGGVEENEEVSLNEDEQATPQPEALLFSPETPSDDEEDELKAENEVAENTLARKFQNTPIQDIWHEIGINQQFLFTNELFQGNKEAFEESVEALNNLNDREEAIAFVENTLKPRFEWDPEDETVAQFLNLVERRYLA